jgi:hypothetical protein
LEHPNVRKESRVEYVLQLYTNEQLLSSAERESRRAAITQLADELQSTGQFLSRFILYPPRVAMCVRERQGNRFVMNGPFAETREQLDGILVVKVNKLEAALAIAARVPMGKVGAVEIRQLVLGTDLSS